MKKLSKEELLSWLGQKNDYQAKNPLFNSDLNSKAREQIRQLIQNQPEVDEKFIEDWILKLSDWREKKIKFSCLQILLQILIEAGVKIKEEE